MHVVYRAVIILEKLSDCMQIKLFLTLRNEHAFKRMQASAQLAVFSFSFSLFYQKCPAGSVQWRCRLAPHHSRALLLMLGLLLAWLRIIIGIPRSYRRLRCRLLGILVPRSTPTPLLADSPPFIGSWHPLCIWSRSKLQGIFAYLFIGEVAHHLVPVSAVPPKTLWRGPSLCF